MFPLLLKILMFLILRRPSSIFFSPSGFFHWPSWSFLISTPLNYHDKNNVFQHCHTEPNRAQHTPLLKYYFSSHTNLAHDRLISSLWCFLLRQFVYFDLCHMASLCWRCAEGHSQKKFPRAKIVITTCPCAGNTTCEICMQNVPQAQQNLGSARESYSPLLWNCIFFLLANCSPNSIIFQRLTGLMSFYYLLCELQAQP